MEPEKLTPIELVEKKLLLTKDLLAKTLDVTRITIWRWKTKCGGKIPPKYYKRLHRLAKLRDIDLSYEEVAHGGFLE